MGLGANGMLMGISEEEPGVPCACMGKGRRAWPQGHLWDAGASLSSPVRFFPAFLGDAALVQGGDELAWPQVPPPAAQPMLSPLPMSAPCPISQTEESLIPPYHPCGTASPWKPAALRLPPGNRGGHF